MNTLLIWLKKEPPPIYETVFSYSFCFKKSQELTGCPASLVSESFTIKELKELLKNNFSKTIFLIIITWPETILSKSAISLFERYLKSGLLLGPVFNESIYPHQKAPLPYPYLDAGTFLEVANLMANTNQEIDVSVLDPACFAIQVETLKTLPSHLPLEKIPYQSHLSKKILSGALVHKFTQYYDSPREDLIKLIPTKTKFVLDVGCAKGGLGRALQKNFPNIKVDGIEINPELAQNARPFYRQIWVGKFEEVEIPMNFYDVVVMGDVLEHIYDPWEALKKVYRVLKPGGYFIGSVPNAAHWTIVQQLLRGEFEYIPSGLLCVSHIRFFTLKSLSSLLKDRGFSIEFLERHKPPPTPKGQELIETLVKVGWGSQEELLTEKIVFRARKIS